MEVKFRRYIGIFCVIFGLLLIIAVAWIGFVYIDGFFFKNEYGFLFFCFREFMFLGSDFLFMGVKSLFKCFCFLFFVEVFLRYILYSFLEGLRRV